MSRRPWEARPQPNRGGDGWRYRWSESPIPRVATRRVRMAGVTVPPVWWSWDSRTTDDGSTLELMDAGGFLDGTFTPTLPDTGDVIVALIGGINLSSLTMPAGWTVDATGDVGSLDYRIAHLVVAGGDDYTLSWSPTWDGDNPGGYCNALVWVVAGDGRTPTVTVEETAAASSVQLLQGGQVNGWLCAKSTPDDEQVLISSYPDARVLPDLVYSAYCHDDGTKQPASFAGAPVAAESCDWVAFRMTWA